MSRTWAVAGLVACAGVILLACWFAWKGRPLPPEPFPEGPVSDTVIDHDNGRVVRRDPSGQVLWSTPLEGYLGRVRPPHLLADADRAYISGRARR